MKKKSNPNTKPKKMSRRNKIIDQNIESAKNNLEYQQIQKEFFEKKGDKDRVKQIQSQIDGYEEDIEIWESLKEE